MPAVDDLFCGTSTSVVRAVIVAGRRRRNGALAHTCTHTHTYSTTHYSTNNQQQQHQHQHRTPLPPPTIFPQRMQNGSSSSSSSSGLCSATAPTKAATAAKAAVASNDGVITARCVCACSCVCCRSARLDSAVPQTGARGKFARNCCTTHAKRANTREHIGLAATTTTATAVRSFGVRVCGVVGRVCVICGRHTQQSGTCMDARTHIRAFGERSALAARRAWNSERAPTTALLLLHTNREDWREFTSQECRDSRSLCSAAVLVVKRLRVCACGLCARICRCLPRVGTPA